MITDEFKRSVVQATLRYLRLNEGKKITPSLLDALYEELSEMLDNTIEHEGDDDD